LEEIIMEKQEEKQLELSVVFPVHNEESSLEELFDRSSLVLKTIIKLSTWKIRKNSNLFLLMIAATIKAQKF